MLLLNCLLSLSFVLNWNTSYKFTAIHLLNVMLLNTGGFFILFWWVVPINTLVIQITLTWFTLSTLKKCIKYLFHSIICIKPNVQLATSTSYIYGMSCPGKTRKVLTLYHRLDFNFLKAHIALLEYSNQTANASFEGLLYRI